MLEVSYDIPNFNVNDVYECVRHNDERMVLWNDDQPKKKNLVWLKSENSNRKYKVVHAME